jgi:hypothetical protein
MGPQHALHVDARPQHLVRHLPEDVPPVAARGPPHSRRPSAQATPAAQTQRPLRRPFARGKPFSRLSRSLSRLSRSKTSVATRNASRDPESGSRPATPLAIQSVSGTVPPLPAHAPSHSRRPPAQATPAAQAPPLLGRPHARGEPFSRLSRSLSRPSRSKASVATRNASRDPERGSRPATHLAIQSVSGTVPPLPAHAPSHSGRPAAQATPAARPRRPLR